jgi:predicted O-linked N-acetylglucosamine transferase (SPINDLY family)
VTTLAQTLDHAMRCHQHGNLAQAEQLYLQILQADPQHVDALHLLGVLAQQRGNHDLALDYLGQAVRLNPDFAEAHYHLGRVLAAQGRPAEAVASYQQALRLQPDHAAAHNNLGVAWKAQGRPAEAVASFQQALRLQPDYAWAHYNLGLAWKEQGRLAEAVASFQQAARLQPDFAEAHNNLGIALAAQGRPAEAAASFQQAVRLKPDYAEAHNNLGIALAARGKVDEAVASYQQALRFKPDYAEAHNNLGAAQAARGNMAEAAACYQQALNLQPDNAVAFNNLGAAQAARGNVAEAAASFQQSLRLQPDFAVAHNNLGMAQAALGELDKAAASYQQAVRLKPDYAEAHNNFGTALKDQGRLEEAVACFRRAVQLKADYAGAHSNLVYTLHFCPGSDAPAIFEEVRRWSRQHAEPLAKFIQPHVNDRSPDRRLRIGYVSPDFRCNPVGQFLLPLLEAHDHAGFEILCYASISRPDVFTDRCRAHADGWREVLNFSDEQLAHAIREDRIDILIDLTVHMRNNRLLVFARKPAPVQATYLAYCSTTGLRTMDYRLTDPYLDQPGQDEPFYSEQSIRLPETYWCFRPIMQTPAVNSLPALRAGQVTFGCLNNFSKVTAPTLAAWSRLLQALPEARLVLHAPPGSHRDRVLDFFAQQNVSPDRLTFAARAPTAEYYQMYQLLDVALDTFPFGGGATTCDALWMGVPVVSLAGQTAVSRGGLSILSNVGLADLAAQDAEEYVHLALNLANDLPRLGELRATLRARMQASPLMDASRFARNIEAAYRSMWQRWCARSM